MEPRYKTYIGGRKTLLCKGKENTCTKEARREGFCLGCRTGRNANVFKNRIEGEIFTDGRGIRYKFVGNQSRKLCIGDDNTCTSIRADVTNLCHGHKTGAKRRPNEGLKVGDIIEWNGEQRVFNGKQLCKLCSHQYCTQRSVNGGKCKKHSPHWWCKFAEEPCTSIRVDGTDFCSIHRNGVQNPREKSKGEALIAAYLDSKGIKYINNKAIVYNGKTIYPDFILSDYNAAIEFDGNQHFETVEYWGGEEMFKRRLECDLNKDQWVRDCTQGMLRLSFADVECMSEYIDTFLELLLLLGSKNNIVATDFAGYSTRGYVII